MTESDLLCWDHVQNRMRTSRESNQLQCVFFLCVCLFVFFSVHISVYYFCLSRYGFLFFLSLRFGGTGLISSKRSGIVVMTQSDPSVTSYQENKRIQLILVYFFFFETKQRFSNGNLAPLDSHLILFHFEIVAMTESDRNDHVARHVRTDEECSPFWYSSGWSSHLGVFFFLVEFFNENDSAVHLEIAAMM